MKKLLVVAVFVTVLLAWTTMAQRPQGIDVSSYQGAPNWGSIKGCGWVFGYAKAH